MSTITQAQNVKQALKHQYGKADWFVSAETAIGDKGPFIIFWVYRRHFKRVAATLPKVVDGVRIEVRQIPPVGTL